MILKRILEYWESNGDTLPAGYQPAFITKKIVLDANGRLVGEGVVALSGEKRGPKIGKTIVVPREQPQRTGAIRPRLVQDNPEYALGFPKPDADPKKVEQRHTAYREQLRACYEETGEASLKAVLSFLESGVATLPEFQEKIDPAGDELVFEVGGILPTDLPSVRAYWTRDEDAATGTCLVTGTVGKIVDRMPFAIKGVPAGQTSGTMLVSVNNPSGESYGLSAAGNSPIGAVAAEGICNGLNRLLASSKQSFRVGDSVYVYWTTANNEFDLFSFFREPDVDSVTALLKSVRRGMPASDVSVPDFFVLGLTANASRIVIRDFHETTLGKVQEHLGKWFRRLEIVGANGSLSKPLGVFQLAASLYRDAKDIPRHVPIEIMKSAFSGSPLPKHLLALAVRRNTIMQGPFAEYQKKRQISVARLALIKAVIVSHQTETEETNLSTLNHNHPDPAYHCGRLLSVLDSIQRIAIPGLNSTLVDKHYGNACGSPGIAFGGLLKDATSAHLPKLRKNRRGAYVALDQRLQEVLEKIENDFPKTLDFERQGLFALGFYHQRADDLAAARANKELKEIAEATTTETEIESE